MCLRNKYFFCLFTTKAKKLEIHEIDKKNSLKGLISSHFKSKQKNDGNSNSKHNINGNSNSNNIVIVIVIAIVIVIVIVVAVNLEILLQM